MEEKDYSKTALEVANDLLETRQPATGLPMLSVQAVLTRVHAIETLMKDVMKEGTHYGTIPGTDRKTLYKSGGEKLGLLFQMSPSFQVETIFLGDEHREYKAKCSLTGTGGQFLGEGMGSCSTMESKYRYRWAELKCPTCGKESIIKGSDQYGGGWYCWPKKGGCKARFAAEDPAITGQDRGKVENPDIADVYNTVLKMAKKRAFLDAVLTVTAASDMFAPEDQEEGGEGGGQQVGKGSTGNGQQKKGGGKSKLAPGPLAKELHDFVLAWQGGSLEDAAATVRRLTGKDSWEDLTEGEARNALAKAKAEAKAKDQPPAEPPEGQKDMPF